MVSLLTLIIGCWVLCNIMPIIIIIMGGYEQLHDSLYIHYGSPKYIYDNSKLNWFGAVVSFLGLFLLFPVYYLMLGIYWLFHIGRK